MIRFPNDFVWGTATASYQIEGAWLEGGKGLSIWDAFTHTPGKINNGDTGDIACDFFHNYKERVWLEIQLAVSRDSIHFRRLSDRSPFIPVGGVGEWDRFNNAPCIGPPVVVGDELRFYYSGRNKVHGGAYEGNDDGINDEPSFIAATSYGSIKRDRFAGLEASFDQGVLLTKTIQPSGRTLHINADIRFGRLQVKVLNADGKPIGGMDCRIREQDSLDFVLPLELMKTKQPIRLEFRLSNGKLYSFWTDD